MKESKKELLSFVENFNYEKELNNLTKEEVHEWIIEEWEELKEARYPIGEAVSIIKDGYIAWMNLSEENKLFVHEKVYELVKKDGKELNDYLESEIKKLKKR